MATEEGEWERGCRVSSTSHIQLAHSIRASNKTNSPSTDIMRLQFTPIVAREIMLKAGIVICIASIK